MTAIQTNKMQNMPIQELKRRLRNTLAGVDKW